MDKTTDKFEADIVERLTLGAKTLQIADVTRGDRNGVFASAKPFFPPAGLKPPRLVIRKMNSHMGIQVRNLLWLGTGTSQMNAAAGALLHKVFLSVIKRDSQIDVDTVILMRLLVNQYLSGLRTADELLAQVIGASNDTLITTKAVVDSRDGEVLVTTALQSDFQTVPKDFEEHVGAVLQHAALVGQFVLFMRSTILPSTVATRGLQEEMPALKSPMEEDHRTVHVRTDHVDGDEPPVTL